MADSQERAIEQALAVACRWGGIDGEHHKTWVIDQMVRALTGCPFDDDVATGASRQYEAWAREQREGEDGPDAYRWDEGIAP